VLQAIASWSVAFERWRLLNDFQRHKGAYPKAPLTRQVFSPVPLRSFDLLWHDRRYEGPVEIEISTDAWNATMEFIANTSEQVLVRPKPDVTPDVLRAVDFRTVFAPPMSGLGTAEPVYQAPKLAQLLGMGRPGEIIRNLLVQASETAAWAELCEGIRRLFGYELLPPDSSGPDIVAEYRPSHGARPLDIASAGSGFQQVLMLLTFMHTRSGSVLLVDEPDAHLHVILQDAIYGELRSVAARTNSQLVVATHSEVIIDSVDPGELCVLFDHPRLLADRLQRDRLRQALGILSQTDVMLAQSAPGILYVEGHTDLELLRAWAKVLNHPARDVLDKNLFWHPTVWENRDRADGVKARDHHRVLQLVRDGLPGLMLLDGDDRGEIPETPIDGQGLQVLRWSRYEAESYLFHPAALATFVKHAVGDATAPRHLEDLGRHLKDNYPPPFLANPLGDFPFLKGTKARKDLIPPALDAAGLPGIPYTRYHEIAVLMKPEEIHPEVVEKLDAILAAFGLPGREAKP